MLAKWYQRDYVNSCRIFFSATDASIDMIEATAILKKAGGVSAYFVRAFLNKITSYDN